MSVTIVAKLAPSASRTRFSSSGMESPSRGRTDVASSCTRLTATGHIGPADASGEMGLRPLRCHAVDRKVDLLVVEADEAGDLHRLRQGCPVGPRQVLMQRPVYLDRPVGGGALVRTVRDGVRGPQEVEADLGERKVVPRRKPGLEEDPRLVRVGDQYAVDADLDPAGAGQDVDPRIRVTGMRVDGL